MPYSVINDGLTTIAVDVAAIEAADVTTYVEIDRKTNDNDTLREIYYQAVGGDEDFPKVARFGSYTSPNANDGIGSKNTSVRISDWVQKTDAGGDIEYTAPLQVVIAINAGGTRFMPDVAAIRALIEEAFSLIVRVQSGAVSTVELNQLSQGVLTTAMDEANSASV